MGILVNTGFDVGSSSPIDNRTLKDTTVERDALVTDGLVYENLKVYCKDTQTEYRWTGTDWEEVGSGGTADNSTHKTVTFGDNINMGRYLLLAKITDAKYTTNNIIKFSCPNFKGQGDGFNYEDDMDILKFELHFNTGSYNTNNDYGVTLKQHGLVLYSYPLNNPQNTAPEIKEAVRVYWDYNNGVVYVFLVDMEVAIPHCVLEYTGSGTLLEENTFVGDTYYNWQDGLNGTWEASNWKSISYDKLETPPIYELGGGSGSTEGSTTYTSLEQLGLTADATIDDVISALKDGETLLGS